MFARNPRNMKRGCDSLSMSAAVRKYRRAGPWAVRQLAARLANRQSRLPSCATSKTRESLVVVTGLRTVANSLPTRLGWGGCLPALPTCNFCSPCARNLQELVLERTFEQEKTERTECFDRSVLSVTSCSKICFGLRPQASLWPHVQNLFWLRPQAALWFSCFLWLYLFAGFHFELTGSC